MSTTEIDVILQAMLGLKQNVSDLHFYVNRPPQVEVDGVLYPASIPGLERLTPFQVDVIARMVLSNNIEALKKFDQSGSADFSYSIAGVCRFRVNAYRQRGTSSMVMRVIPFDVPTMESLNLPEVLHELVNENNGIALVTGPTGSGKSTTIAAIIEQMNKKRPCHIVTIEDPIEYLYRHKVASICQRELGADTTSFASALRDALRQSPKVIVVGEMRDRDTVEIALEAAETGHLVLSTLHTIDASKAIDRILGIFPKSEEQQIRTRFSQTFRYVLAQRLIPKAGGGRILAMEILKSTPRTREYIMKGEGENRSLLDAMKDGNLEGMQSFDQVLEKLVRSKMIDMDIALQYATNSNNLALALHGSTAEEVSVSWEDMLTKEEFSVHDIYQLPSTIQQIRAGADPNQIRVLIDRLLSRLSAGEPPERIAVLKTLPSLLSVLSEDPSWAGREASAMNLVHQCLQRETEEDVLIAYAQYYQSSLIANLKAKNFEFCNEMLQGISSWLEGEAQYKKHFSSGLSNAEDLVRSEIQGGAEGADIAIEYLRLCGEKGADFLFRWLEDEETRFARVQILNYIGRLDPPELASQIERRLDDYRWYVVRNMITILSKRDLPEASTFLAQVADHEDVRVIKEILKKLYQSSTPQDSSLILRYLQHNDKSVRLQAVHLVSEANLQAGAPYLLRLLAQTGEADTDLRAACFQALGRLKVKEALAPAQKVLEKKASSRNEIAERNAAVKLLAEVAPGAFTTLLKKVAQSDSNKETREVADSYLGA